MPPPSGPAVEEVLRLLPFAAAAALQRVAVGRGEGEALSVRLEIPVGPVLAAIRRASEVRAILSSGRGPLVGRLGCQGLCRRAGASCCHAFCRFLGEPAPGVLLRPGQRCSSRLRLEGGLCPPSWLVRSLARCLVALVRLGPPIADRHADLLFPVPHPL